MYSFEGSLSIIENTICMRQSKQEKIIYICIPIYVLENIAYMHNNKLENILPICDILL